jgi:hypothetical protein
MHRTYIYENIRSDHFLHIFEYVPVPYSYRSVYPTRGVHYYYFLMASKKENSEKIPFVRTTLYVLYLGVF